ncbi:MAG: PcfB family protein, partial [Clostridia bacterium]|nr:PcfB family protein [Clostridia bacterium]
MNTSGEVADLMVKEGLMITEEVVKLTGLGAKNLAAIVIALLKEDNKLQGKTNLKKLLKSDKPLCILQIKENDIGKFNSEAKKYGVLFTAVNDKSNDSGLCDIIAKQD